MRFEVSWQAKRAKDTIRGLRFGERVFFLFLLMLVGASSANASARRSYSSFPSTSVIIRWKSSGNSLANFVSVVMLLLFSAAKLSISAHLSNFFFVFLSYFSYLCKRILPIDEVSQPTNTNSLSARCKTFARTRQDFAPPAARYCHGRGKLVTPYLRPCYLRSFPLSDAVFSP